MNNKMSNSEIFYLSSKNRTISQFEYTIRLNEYDKIKNKINNEILKKINKIINSNNIEISYNFNILNDFCSKNCDLIISHSSHHNFINLFDFNIFVGSDYNSSGHLFIHEPLFKLARIKFQDCDVDIKRNILDDIKIVENKFNGQLYFNIMTTISVNDFKTHPNELIQLQLESNIDIDCKMLKNELVALSKKYGVLILKSDSPVVFSSYIEKKLGKVALSDLLKKQKTYFIYGISFDRIDDLKLRQDLINLINPYVSDSNNGFFLNKT